MTDRTVVHDSDCDVCHECGRHDCEHLQVFIDRMRDDLVVAVDLLRAQQRLDKATQSGRFSVLDMQRQHERIQDFLAHMNKQEKETRSGRNG